MRIAWIIALSAALAAPLSGGLAHAGAFVLEPGEAKLFATAFAMSGDQYFDADGDLRKRERFKKRELQLYGEFGLLDGVTLFGAGGLQRIVARDRGRHVREGVARSELGLRARVLQRDGWIVSVQGSGLIAGAKGKGDIAVIGETDDQADLRLLAARSFEIAGKPAFLDLAAGYRARSGDPADEARLEATLGVRPVEPLLLMAQSFSTIGLSRWRGPYRLKQRIHKLQAAAMYDVSTSVSLVAAGFFTPAGRDALEETGATLGVAFRY